METWVLYAIIWFILAGLFWFGSKVIARRNYNTSYVSFIAYCSATLVSAFYFLYKHFDNLSIDNYEIILLMWLWNSFFFFGSMLTRVEGHKNIDTTIFFPLYKTFFPIFITIISYFYLWEDLSFKQFLWILCWIAIPLFLITSAENKIQKNLKKGLIFVLLTSIFATVSTMFPKYMHILQLNLDFFIFTAFISGAFWSFLSYKVFDKDHPHKKFTRKWIYPFAFVLWFIQSIWMIFFTYALEWNFAVAITINSFSILIPIILSVIFYKEEMTKKKAFVIFLSIVSVILFI